MNSSVPIDDILSLWKKKRRYSIESSDDSSEIEADKKVKITSKRKVSLIKEEKFKKKKDRKVDVALKSKVERRDEIQDNANCEVERQDEIDDNSDCEIERQDEIDDNYNCEVERQDEIDDNSNCEVDDSYSSDESYSPENKVDDSSTDDESYSSKKKKNSYRNAKKRTRAKNPKSESVSIMCSYEKMVEERKLEKIAFLQSLKISEAKCDLRQLLARKKKKRVKTDEENCIDPEQQSGRLSEKGVRKQGKANRKKKQNIQGAKNAEKKFEPLRRSKRLVKQIQCVENKLCWKPTWSFKESFAMEEKFFKEYVECINIQEPKQEKPVLYNKSVFKGLQLDSSNKYFMNENTFTSLTWHPSAEPLVLVAGNKKGYVVILDVDMHKCPYFFKPHTELVSNLQFNPYNPAQLFSTSFDCKFLCGDMVKQVFSEVYKTDAIKLNYFDILSLTTYLIALKNGKVSVVDNRTQRNRETQLTCHTNSVETVNLHPSNQNYFVTSENNGFIHLWDLRKIQKYPLNMVSLEETWHSAFFSPTTGNSILATTDNNIYSFDSTHLTGDLNLLQEKRFPDFHSCRARASWVPNSDEMFVIGSVNKNKIKIEVYDKSMNLYHSIMSSKSTSNCTFINAFHPYVPAFSSTHSVNNEGFILAFT